jgi:uncharacterized protein (DUF2267 family)
LTQINGVAPDWVNPAVRSWEQGTMSATGLDTFDTSIHATNHWLKIVMQELGTDNRRVALAALRASLHALRDRIGLENAVHFGAQLPMLLRGLYYEGWRPAGTPTRERHLEDFLDHVAAMLPARCDVSPADAALASFAAVTECVAHPEALKLIMMLPREIRPLWPSYLFEAELDLVSGGPAS